MGWAKARTTEMPAVPVSHGRHRRTHPIMRLAGVLVLVAAAVTAVIYAPVLVGLPPLTASDERPAAGPLRLPVTDAPTDPVPASPTDGSGAGSPSPTGAASTTSSPSASPKASPRSTPKPTHKANPVTATPMVSMENDVLRLTNDARAQNGCRPLTMNTHLLAAARLHSADMAQNNYFDHISKDGRDPGKRMRAAGYDTSGGWAENIAAGYPTPDAVMAGWLGSAGHRANILNCALKSIGIGIARGRSGWLYWTQDFGGR
jgi:uncharacterized protein YkwD